MAITKSISFFAPYIVNELNAQIDNIAGGDALLYGGEITVQTSTTVDIAPYIFIQNGVTVFQDEVTSGVVVPDYASFKDHVHILVSSPDSTDTSGVTISVAEGNQDANDDAIVIASRSQNVWVNPPLPSLIELRKEALLSRADASGARLSDADVEFDDGYKGWGTNQGFHLKQGEIADSAGVKKTLGVDTSLGEPNSSIEFDLTSVDPDFPRTDYIIARRSSDNLNVPPEIVYAKGETLSLNNPYYEDANTTPTRSISTSAGNTKPSVAYNATGEHVVVYGNGTDLYHARLDHTATRAIGVGPTATAAGGTVSDVFLAERKDIESGDRLYGCCIIGTEVAIFRTTADGASIGVSDIHIFTSMTFTPSNPHMVVTGEGTTDNPLYAHIVFQHPEAPPNNSQIYYTKYALADATWGTAGAVAVSPKFARGFNGGLNHTAPYIQAHPDGNLHIAYVHAGGALTTGEIRHLVINQACEVVTPEQALATGTNEVNDGTGTGITLGSANAEQPKVVISPQGSVYVVWVDLSKAVLANEGVIAWEPTMLERTGFDAVVLYSDFSVTSIEWHSAFSDDLGNLCWLGVTVSGIFIKSYWFKFQPTLVSDGINIAPDSLNIEFDTDFTNSVDYAVENNSSGEAIFDRDGSISIVDLITNTVSHTKLSSMSRVELFQDKKQVHPRDKYIAQISIPVGASNTISSAADVHVHPTKIKSLPPITVFGKDGQKGTFTGLQDAIWSLRGVGGRVLIKGGEYEFLYPIEVLSGVEVVGDGHVVLVQSGYNTAINIESLNYLEITESDATRQIYTISGGGETNLLHWARVGDVGMLWNWNLRPVATRSEFSDPFAITKILDNSTFQASRSLTADIAAAGGGSGWARVSIYSTGTKLQNLTIYDNRSAGFNVTLLDIESTYFGVFKDLHIIQTQGVATVVDSRGSYGTRFENIIVDKDGTNTCFNMEDTGQVHNFDTTLSHCAFRGDVSLSDFVGLRVDGCVAENWTVTGTPTEVPVWTNNAGAISATSFDTAASWADDASVFANRIVLNEDSGFDTNGNIRGNLVPTGATSAVGNTTKKWEETVAQSHVARPENSSEGLVVNAQDLTSYWYNTEKVGKIVDYTGQVIDEMETTGLWAGCNILEDDFMYSSKNWVFVGSEAADGWPDERYDFPGTDLNGSPTVAMASTIPDALLADAGGVLRGRTSNSADEFAMEAATAFDGASLSATKKITFKAKYAIGGSTDPLYYRTDELGFRAGSDYKIFVRYNTTSSIGLPWYLVVDDGVNPETAVGIPVSTPTTETWIVFYIMIDNAKVEAWTSNADEVAEKASITFSADPVAPSSSDKFAPYWRMLQGATANYKDGYLDYWRAQNNVLRR